MRKTEHRHAGRLSAAILALMLLFAASCMSGTPESVPAEDTGTQTRSGDPAGQDGTGTESQAPELHGQVYSSIAQLFRETDPDWSESEAYTDAVLAYEMLVPGILDVWRNDSQLLEPHFAAAYIDADHIPELLVSYGDFHLGSITIYGYDNVKQETFHAGDYGSFGTISYYPGNGVVESYYGAHGYYTSYLTGISGRIRYLVDVWCMDASGSSSEDILCYYGFPVPEGDNGSRNGISADRQDIAPEGDPGRYLVSEEALRAVLSRIRSGLNPPVQVLYSDMYRISLGEAEP